MLQQKLVLIFFATGLISNVETRYNWENVIGNDKFRYSAFDQESYEKLLTVVLSDIYSKSSPDLQNNFLACNNNVDSKDLYFQQCASTLLTKYRNRLSLTTAKSPPFNFPNEFYRRKREIGFFKVGRENSQTFLKGTETAGVQFGGKSFVENFGLFLLKIIDQTTKMDKNPLPTNISMDLVNKAENLLQSIQRSVSAPLAVLYQQQNDNNKLQDIPITNAENTYDNNPNTIRLLSPKFMPLIKKSKEVSILSPDIFSLYSDQNNQQNVLSLSRYMHNFNVEEQRPWWRLFNEISGISKVNDVLARFQIPNHQDYNGLENNEMRPKFELLDKNFESIIKTMTSQQLKNLNNKGYTFLDYNQLVDVYGSAEKMRSTLQLDLNEYKTVSDNDKEILLLDSLINITQRKITPRRSLVPQILAPLIFSTTVLEEFVLAPDVLSPIILSATILGPLVLSPYILSPYVLSPFILSPNVLSPYVLSPLILNPAILSPLVLGPSILSPVVLSPLILSPDVLTPNILSPSVLSPVVLSPAVFSPNILSPGVDSPFVLSPRAFSPDILSEGVHSPSVLSPCFMCKRRRKK